GSLTRCRVGSFHRPAARIEILLAHGPGRAVVLKWIRLLVDWCLQGQHLQHVLCTSLQVSLNPRSFALATSMHQAHQKSHLILPSKTGYWLHVGMFLTVGIWANVISPLTDPDNRLIWLFIIWGVFLFLHYLRVFMGAGCDENRLERSLHRLN